MTTPRAATPIAGQETGEPSIPRRSYFVNIWPVRGLLAGIAIGGAALAAGCGDKEDDTGRVRGAPDPAHVREVARDPYAITCRDLARQELHPEASKLVIRAEFALAQVPELRRVVARETLNRTGRSVYYAMTEICKAREPSFEPGRLAVEGVQSGKYRAARNRPG
jgi:hypothetical protein